MCVKSSGHSHRKKSKYALGDNKLAQSASRSLILNHRLTYEYFRSEKTLKRFVLEFDIKRKYFWHVKILRELRRESLRERARTRRKVI